MLLQREVLISPIDLTLFLTPPTKKKQFPWRRRRGPQSLAVLFFVVCISPLLFIPYYVGTAVLMPYKEGIWSTSAIFVFFVLLFFCRQGLLLLRRTWVWSRAKSTTPGWPHAWPHEASVPSERDGGWRWLLLAVAMPIGAVSAYSHDYYPGVLGLLVLCALVTRLSWRNWQRFFTQPKAKLSFDTLPIPRTGPLTATWAAPIDLTSCAEAKLTLRACEEISIIIETAGHERNARNTLWRSDYRRLERKRSLHPSSHVLETWTASVDLVAAKLLPSLSEFHFSIPLPAGRLVPAGNAIFDRDPLYWELVIEARLHAQGRLYRWVHLLPLYGDSPPLLAHGAAEEEGSVQGSRPNNGPQPPYATNPEGTSTARAKKTSKPTRNTHSAAKAHAPREVKFRRRGPGPHCPRCGNTLNAEGRCASGHGQLLVKEVTLDLLGPEIGTSMDDLRAFVLTVGNKSFGCPNCQANAMSLVPLKGQPIELCSQCGSAWVDRGEREAIEETRALKL